MRNCCIVAVKHWGYHMVRRFLGDRSAATAIEYGLIVAVLSLAIVAGVSTASNSVKLLFTDTAGTLDSSVE